MWETPQNVQKAIDICRQLAHECLLSGNKNLKYCEPIQEYRNDGTSS